MLKLSSGPINAAWAVLKAPEEGLDERMLAQIFQNMPPELQERAHAVSQAMGQMDPEKASFMENQSKKLLEAHGLDNVLEQSHSLKDPSMVRRSLPLDIIYEGRIAKFFPLVIGAIFVADAILRSQGQKTSYIGATLHQAGHTFAPDTIPEGPDWAGTREYADEASLITPWGSEAYVTEDPTWYERVKMGVLSAGSAFVNPFGLLGGVGRTSSRMSGAVGREAARTGGKLQQATGRGIARTGSKNMATRQAQLPPSAQGLSDMPGVVGGVKPNLRHRAGKGIEGWGQARIDRANLSQAEAAALRTKDMARTGGESIYGKLQRLAGAGGRTHVPWRAYQGLAAAGAPQALAGMAAGWGASQMPNVNPSTAGYSPHDSGGFGMANTGYGGGGFATDYNQGDIHTGISHRTGLQEVWKPTGSAFEQQHEFSGFKGENMKIGDRMLKELTDMMYKAKCPKCGKDPCVCKDYANKGDKKPAHGMVIVIGSKAGPGPSTDGKRDKLDSEKDDKDE